MATNTKNNFLRTTCTDAVLAPSLTNSGIISSVPFNTIQNSSGKEVVRIPFDEATLDVKGRIKMNGEYLDERLERIETMLNIPVRDIEIENEFPRLKTIWEEYNRELEKYKTWKRINI